MVDKFTDAGVGHWKFARRTESAPALDRLLLEHGFSGTLTDKSGRKRTYQDGKPVAGQHDQGGGKPAPAHNVEQSLQADIDNLSPESAAKVKGLIGRVGDKVNAFILNHATTFARLGTAASVIEAFITTPEDVQKSPWLASKFAGGQTAGDHIADGMTAELGVGVPGTVVTKLVAAALAHGWRAAKKQLGLSESEGVDFAAAGEFLAGLLDAVHEGLGLPTGTDAAAIAEQLKTLQGGGS
jgi:hypothetical protein